MEDTKREMFRIAKLMLKMKENMNQKQSKTGPFSQANLNIPNNSDSDTFSPLYKPEGKPSSYQQQAISK
jgi:hypothetical protein